MFKLRNVKILCTKWAHFKLYACYRSRNSLPWCSISSSFQNSLNTVCSETKQFCCGFDWNFFRELEQSILYYKLWTLCLLHSMKNFHADVMFTCGCEHKCTVKTDRLRDEVCSIWNKSVQTDQHLTSKYREQGRIFRLTVGGDKKHNISQEQFLKGNF